MPVPLWMCLLLLLLLTIAIWGWITSQIRLSFQHKMVESFKALSNDALRQNSESFLQLATARFSTLHSEARGDLQRRQDFFEGIVKPVRETIEKMDTKLHELEKNRVVSESRLGDQVIRLQQETASLVRALRQPHVRGKWGEVQLRRVVEMAGMLEYCDFNLQETATNGDERCRPDMIVRLPGGKNVVVDSKAPLHAYLEAHDLVDEGARVLKLKEHARQVRHHIEELSKKSYWDQFKPAPEFVVLFLPGEPFFSAALEQDPTLIERGVEQKVILATPTTLIALLRAVAYGWRQEVLAENAQLISATGKQLYERLTVFYEHLNGIKRGLEQAVKGYNQAVGSFETRILTSARKLNDLGAGTDKEIPSIEPIDTTCREMSERSELPRVL